MPRILLVKTSSLGDVVHNLPVASDIAAAVPDAQIDWAVEESFSAIPRLHPHVKRVVPVALRRWRRTWFRPSTWREIGQLREALRAARYDAVIDTQGLLKSALVAASAGGRRYGLDWASSREPLRPFYDCTFRVLRSAPAVERNRTLAARALRYTPLPAARFGIRASEAARPRLATSRYAVLVHATSAREKLWPETHWIALGAALRERDLTCVLPWGSAAEGLRSVRLASRIADAVVPPQLKLAEVAALLGGASAVVGVDTGLTHLAGALGVPTVGIYTATDPALTGLYGCERATNVGGIGVVPAVEGVARELDRLMR